MTVKEYAVRNLDHAITGIRSQYYNAVLFRLAVHEYSRDRTSQ